MPRENQAMSKAIATQVDKEFKGADKILTGQLDELMKKFRAGHPGFHKEYKTSRIIIDHRGSRPGSATIPEPPQE